jgi:hypothetical protein
MYFGAVQNNNKNNNQNFVTSIMYFLSENLLLAHLHHDYSLEENHFPPSALKLHWGPHQRGIAFQVEYLESETTSINPDSLR